MPSKFDFLSPGIQITEVDESVITPTPDEDGPIIIGRTRKGPAMKPVKVRNMADYISVFGTPNPGGNSETGDVWRDGAGSKAPTYASYAAQAWLASGEAPVNVVRLLGEEHSSPTAAGYAGWQLSSAAPSGNIADNSTAYGLFVISDSMDGTDTGALAAVIYCDGGALTLSGTIAGDTSLTSAAETFIKADADLGFVLHTHNSSGNEIEKIKFDFNRNGSNYIRNVMNTDPTVTNTDLYSSDAGLKTYWLGQSFMRSVEDTLGTTTFAKDDYCGILLALGSGSAAAGNWGNHRYGMEEGKSGWVIGNDTGAPSAYSATSAVKMFRFVMLHEGSSMQDDIMIAFEDLQLPTNPLSYNYSTFTVRIMDTAGNTLEKYSNLVMDPTSPNYIFRIIGDMYQTWNNSDKRYRSFGDFPNNSDYIRVEKAAAGLPNDTTLLPFGFLGAGRPKGFSLVSGSTNVRNADDSDDFVSAEVQASGAVPFGNSTANQAAFYADGNTTFTASFSFPAIAMRKSGSDGFVPNPYKAYFGINPKIGKDSTIHDRDYCDYLRIPSKASKDLLHSPTGDWENSISFTLDDIVINEDLDTVYWEPDTRVSETSYTAKSGSSGLLGKNVKRWIMPMFGGADGLDIQEIDPFRAGKIDGTADHTNYVMNSLNRAIDSVADEEVVPANLLLVPGIFHSSITSKMIRVAEARQDVLAIIDLEDDYVPAERTANRTAVAPDVSAAITKLKNRNLNSSYACAFFPWVQAVDTLGNSEMVWLPSSVAALGAMASSQAASDVWFAPAGFNRGGLSDLGGSGGPRVVQARTRLDASERDDLYVQNINPIATFPNEGVVIFGQKTLQQTNSALDRINVRRLMLYLKRKISNVAKNVLFDNNVEATWNRFKSDASPILDEVQSRYGLTEYKLILDETTTTPDLIDRNILYAKVFLKPARAIEFIAIDFIISKTGAEFA